MNHGAFGGASRIVTRFGNLQYPTHQTNREVLPLRFNQFERPLPPRWFIPSAANQAAAFLRANSPAPTAHSDAETEVAVPPHFLCVAARSPSLWLNVSNFGS